MKKFPHWPVIVLLLIVILIGITNYTPGSFLTGWDNIHPEFNFSLNIFRSVFSVWQEYQSLGLSAGTGYASDFPRQLILYILSIFLPTSFLRYFYHLLTLFLGALGVYILLYLNIFPNLDKSIRQKVSFLGSIFYLFNLATLQTFFDPFEPVSHHFASLPWLFFGSFNFLQKRGKRGLWLLILIALLSVPQAYVTTYFLVTMIVLSIFYLFIFLKTKNIKSILTCYLVLFIVNAFWLLPNLYYFFFQTSTTINSHINQMSTEDDFLKNKKYGNILNTTLLKGFWFDNVENFPNATTTYQLKDWIPYINDPAVLFFGYLLFLVSLTGIGIAILKKRERTLFFLPVFIFSFIVLSNDTPILSQLGSFFYKLPLFSQIFRFPFTKFSIIAAFCLSIFYCSTFASLTNFHRLRKYTTVLFIIFIALPMLFLIPVFRGDFFDKRNRLEIPQSYFQVMDFFKKQDSNTRIANFPQFSFWGWTYYNWGYRGSGFLWYGIKQPILDRAFDVWSKYSENYYYEISYAIYSGNQKLFEDVLDKYQINWVLVDDAVMSFASQKQIHNDNFIQLIGNSKKLKFEKNFGTITIYSVDLQNKPNKYVYLKKDLPYVYPTYDWNNKDQALVDLGNYISLSDSSKINQAQDFFFYPFRSLYSGRKQEELEFQMKDLNDYFVFSADIPKGINFDNFYIPEFKKEEITEIDEKTFTSLIKEPRIFIDGKLYDGKISPGSKKLEIQVPKIRGYYSYHSSDPDILKFKANPCNEYNKSEYKYQPIKDEGFTLLRLTSKNSSNCLNLDLPRLSHQLGYLLNIKNRNITGKSLLLGLTNHNTRRLDLETYLPKNTKINDSYFVIPPMEKYGIGYTINLDNISYGRVETINDLGNFAIYPIPYSFLTSLKLIKNGNVNDFQEKSYVQDVQHPNPSFYQVKLANNYPTSITLILSQSFDPGWQAFAIDGFRIKRLNKHLLINNWSNGWVVDSPGKIFIIFLPQLLEFLGFGILGTTVILLILYPKFPKWQKNQEDKIPYWKVDGI